MSKLQIDLINALARYGSLDVLPGDKEHKSAIALQRHGLRLKIEKSARSTSSLKITFNP